MIFDLSWKPKGVVLSGDLIPCTDQMRHLSTKQFSSWEAQSLEYVTGCKRLHGILGRMFSREEGEMVTQP
jgi:hypothetical protein